MVNCPLSIERIVAIARSFETYFLTDDIYYSIPILKATYSTSVNNS
ncbi:hypothetical protein [Lusitaniella coriacea]